MSDNVPSAEQQGTGRADEEEADESIFSTGHMDRMELEHRLVIKEAKHLNDLRAEQLKVAKLEVEKAELKARVERMEMQNQIDELKAAAAAAEKNGGQGSSSNNSQGTKMVELEKKMSNLHVLMDQLLGQLTDVGQNAADQAKLLVDKQMEELKKEVDEKLRRTAATSAAADPPAAGQGNSNNNNSVLGGREETANSLLTAMHEMGKRVDKVEGRLTSFAEGQRLQSLEMSKMGNKLMAAKEKLRNEFREKIQQQADKLAEHSIELSDLKKKFREKIQQHSIEFSDLKKKMEELRKEVDEKLRRTAAAADPPAAGQGCSSNNNCSVVGREETANSLLTAMHEMGKRVEKVEGRLTSFAEGQRLQSAEMSKMGDKLMAAKEQLRNEQQAVKLAEHSIEISDLKKKERLNEWLSGIVLFRTGTFLRVAVNQHLVTSGHWSIHAGGLIAEKTAGKWAHVHADQPFPVPHAGPEDKLLYYFEVTITEMNGWCNNAAIGLCGTDFPFNLMNTFVGGEAGSFAIRENGDYYVSGTEAKSGFGTFHHGDVVGCGLLVLPAGRRLFFTKNGDLWVKPILLGAEDAKTNLHPIVSAYGYGTAAEFNFGADKPFKYELSQLDNMDT